MITLLHGDCLDRMKEIEDGSVDLVLTDPPYGTTACKWDAVIPFAPMWAQVWRVLKPNGTAVLFGSEPFSSALRMSQIERFKYDWYWRKSKGSNFVHAPNMPLKIVEVVSVFSSGAVKHAAQNSKGDRMTYNPVGVTESDVVVKQNKNTSELQYHRDSQANHTVGYKCKGKGYPNSILDFKSDNGLHPTQKPVALMEYLIRTYTNPGETVLDFTMGSGTTGVACAKTGRRFIGIERDETYFNIAKERIDGAIEEQKWKLI